MKRVGRNQYPLVRPEARFTVDDPRIQPCPTTGCWLWSGASDVDGYGMSRDGPGKGKSTRAHRMTWCLVNGPIPERMVLDHICRTRSCVNPDHLRVVTPRQNTLENSDCVTAINAAKARCPKCGGSFVIEPSGRRRCRPCKRARDAARMRRLYVPAARRHEQGPWEETN